MLGGYATILPSHAGINLWFSMPANPPISVELFGVVVVERVIIRPLYGRTIETMLAT